MTSYKKDKKIREENIIALINKEKNEKWVSNKFFIRLIDYTASNFSLFMNYKSGISVERIEILEKYFNIKK